MTNPSKLLLPLLMLLLFEMTHAQHLDPFIELADFVKFPKKFEYDSFEDCRRNYREEYAYCVVHARIVPDDSSELWRNISIFSKDELHYDHTLLERGVCIPDCENNLRSRGDLPQTKDPKPYALYAKRARSCINTHLKERYDLRIENHVKIYHCYTPETDNPPVDFPEALFYTVVMILATCIIVSTAYDIRQRNVQGCPDTHFDQDPKTHRERLLVSFSFPRNFCRLKNTGFSKIRQDLQFLEAFRFIQMCRVVFLHSTMGHNKVPQLNTDYMEQLQEDPMIIVFIAEFQNYIQTFLSISGMLLTINFLEHIRKNPDFTYSIFWDKLKARLCRIVPAYAFVILLESSILHRYLDGPIGQQFIGEAEQNCRRWWWTNLLFFNNYVRTDQPCLIQSWYLAVDMQLFIYGLVVMMLIWRWPWTKRYIFTVVFTFAALMPILITFIKDIEPAMTNRMKNANHFNRDHNYQFDIYFPFQQNIGTYSMGMLAGFLYHRYRSSPKNLLKSKWFSAAFFVAVVHYLLCMSSVYWVLEYRNHIHPILKAIYSTAFKHAWSVLTTILQLGLALASGKLLLKKCFSHPFFGVAGKLCYGIYLIHFTIIEIVYAGVKDPVYSNERGVSNIISQIVWWTMIFGTLLTLMVELPTNAALKELLDRRKSNKIHDIRQTQGPHEQIVEHGNC